MEIKVTSKQIEYIKILSNYPDTMDKDAEDIQSFLLQHKSEKIEGLTKEEASTLIKILLERPVKYVFPCKKEKQMSKSDYNRYNIIGELEACLHECEINIYDCQYWKNQKL